MWYTAYSREGKLTLVVNSVTLDAYYLSEEQVLGMLKSGERFYTMGTYSRLVSSHVEFDTYSDEWYSHMKLMSSIKVNSCVNASARDFIFDLEEGILTYNDDISSKSYRMEVFRYNKPELVVVPKENDGTYIYAKGNYFHSILPLHLIRGIYKTKDDYILGLYRGSGLEEVRLVGEPRNVENLGSISRVEFLRKMLL